MPSFSIRNFGCRVNQAEAFQWAESLRKMGLRLEEDPSRSDWILVNSCTLTARADRDVRKFVRRAGQKFPKARLVVTGCYAERAGRELAKMPQVVLVVPNSDKQSLPERILSLVEVPMRADAGDDTETGISFKNGLPPANGGSSPGPIRLEETGREPKGAHFEEADSSYRSRALVKIQDGCNNRCTFCVIPLVRGRSVSTAWEDVRARIVNLAEQGYREIVLAGIHLSSYGEDQNSRGSLLGLLRKIRDIEGLGRVRLSSLDPRRMDDELVAYIAGNPKICQHFHLSLQHASERILKKMGRNIGPGRYGEILTALRRRSPEAALGADVIVGFPEETGDDFRLLRDFLRHSPLTYFHVFPFSPRPGTPAARRPQVQERTKKDRSQELRSLSAEKSLRFRSSFEGRTLEAVVIRNDIDGGENDAGSSVRDEGVRAESLIELLTGNYIKIYARKRPEARHPTSEREIVPVRIVRAFSGTAEGEIVR